MKRWNSGRGGLVVRDECGGESLKGAVVMGVWFVINRGFSRGMREGVGIRL